MSSRPKSVVFRRALTLVLLAAALACGKQGPPLPPLRAVPAATKDLSVVQQGPRLLLSFTYPSTTPAGTALEGISSVQILSASRQATSEGKANPMDPREFAGAAKPLQTITGADLTAATSGSRIDVPLPLPAATAGAAPQASYFAIRTYGKNGDESELSNVVSVVPRTPPAAPERITVTARADGIQIEWSPVEGATAGYNIYRRDAQERAHGKPLHTAGAQERSWLDNTARFGQSYIYTVTSLARQEPVLESAITSDHEVRYLDRFPPPPPTELVALTETGRARLVWRLSEGEDVAGYLVYRRDDGGDWARITDKPVEVAEFVDTTIRSGRTYFYRVTAVDQTGNESAPGNEVRTAAP